MFRLSLVLTLSCSFALAQHVEVTKQNRTISISAEQTLYFPPDLAKLSLGRQDYAPTSDEAFLKTKAAMAQVIEALHHLGLKDDILSTTTVTISEGSPDADTPKDERTRRKFRSFQSVAVTVPANQAQAVLDAAIGAGANDIETAPEWILSDDSPALAQTAGAALKKARLNAEQMAAGLGAKIGELVYASNTVPNSFAYLVGRSATLNTMSARIGNVRSTPQPKLQLFPKPVEIKATVYATFAIE